MTFFSLIQVLPVVYCGGGEISPRVKPNSRSCLEAQPMFPFPWGVMGKIFWENSLWSLDFATTYAQQRTKYNARIKYNAFWFRREKSTLRMKIKRWFFYMMSANAFPLGISKKIGKIYFGFRLLSFFLKKIGYSHFYAGGAWKRRRTTYADFEYEIWKVFDTPIHGKSLRCLRW